MVKNKNNKAIWNSRIKSKTSALYKRYGGSINIDKKLFKEDIIGSIAHVEMLFKQKIISFKIKNKIIYGLNKIEKEISNNKFDEKFIELARNVYKFNDERAKIKLAINNALGSNIKEVKSYE